MPMKPRFALLSSAVLLALASAPALAMQLGQIQVKSALNEPLVAEIPLKPDNLAELQGLTVGLASNQDFARAGLTRSGVDDLLRFQVVTDSSGSKVILVTSTQPITDPYLDFLLQVNTRQGKQVREFVVLLDPMIASPAPAVQAAPVASAPAAAPAPVPPPEAAAPPQPAVTRSPPPPATPQPAEPQSFPPPRPVVHQPLRFGPVPRGDTLYHIAQQLRPDSSVSINQMMLALKAANPDAFFKDNINNLKAGAILRIPARDDIDRISIARANAEVHRQYEDWRGTRARAATVVAGSAAQAASAPAAGREAAPESDRLTLVPPAGSGGSATSRPGVNGGTGNATVAGLKQQLETDRETLTSLQQSN